MIDKFERLVRASSNFLANISAALLLVIMVMVFGDIMGSKFFARPVPGCLELTGFFQTLVVTLAAALTQIYRLNIRVEFFTARLPESIKARIDAIISLVALCLFITLIWQSCRFGISLQGVGEYSSELHLGICYVVYAMAISLIPLCFVFLLDFLHSLRGVRSK